MNAPAFWRGRSARERRILALGGATVAVLLVVALVWIPLARTHARFERELPQLRASVDRLQQQADEVRRLRAAPVAGTSAANGGTTPALAGAEVSTPAAGRLRLVAKDVSFTALLDWLTAVEAAQGLHVESATVESLPTSGRVRADVTLARS